MALFQKTVISKYLQTQNPENLTAKWDLFRAHFHNPLIQENIRNSKEEQYQEGFLRDLFVSILGYQLNPAHNFNLTTEYKNIKDSKKADGAIIIDEVVTAIIELKGMNITDLSKVEDQAFGYKNNQENCKYVITSNFQKVRFYVDNAIEHIEFNLFELTQEQFNLMYLILAFENIKNNIPKKLKDESLNQEDIVTKKLYKDYSVFKRELFQNLILLNPDYNPLLLFQKSQKLLDRLLFLFFGEDRGLLPPNSVRQILAQWNKLQDLDEYVPLYNRYKKYFGYLNTGFKGKNHDVFAYNGGLFKEDEVLDNITIDDQLLYDHTFRLSQYDFASEVDVNILGHIFENSLNEIDEIKAQLEGQEIDKSKSKRKKDGVFYTPKYITKYIVENTIGKLCEEKKGELGIIEEEYFTDKKRQQKTSKNLLDKLDHYRDWLLQLTIVDPACGSGAFLNEALNFLIKEHQYIDELEAKLRNVPIIFSYHSESILEHNLFGVDLNEESVEIAKLSLWLRTAEPNRKLNSLNENIKCGNSLIDDPEVAGDKAFNWKKEFPQVFAKGGFDVVIGNPPYVRVQNLNYHDIDYYKKHKQTAFKRVDISTLFFELSYEIVNKNGILGFITSNQFQSTEYGQEIRNYINANYNIYKIIDFGDLPVFEGALTYVSIYLFDKRKKKDFQYSKIEELTTLDFNQNQIIIDRNQLNDDKWIFTSDVINTLISKLNKNPKLSDFGKSWAGLFTGKDEILMFDYSQMISSKIEKDIFLPVLRAEDVDRYGEIKASKFVIYPYKVVGKKTVVLTEDELKSSYPNAFQYLIKHKEQLQSRKDSRKTFGDRNDWFALTRFGTKDTFQKKKIVSPGEVKNHKFSIDYSASGFSCARVFAITVDDSNLQYLLTLINSNLAKFYLQRNSSVKAGGYFSYSSNVLNSLPVVNISSQSQQPFIEKADFMLSLNKNLQELTAKFQRTCERKFENLNLNKKLQDWYNLSYADFIKELSKQKIKLTLSEEAEWADYFDQEKSKALELQSKIASTDKEIDQMVYELYGLSEEEIKIVENN